ncbi:MAG: hypothetical protein MJ220_02335 [Bacilli bacterium]|nr:hypothetical protein [Bacilli bacterium]
MINFEYIHSLINDKEKQNEPLRHGSDKGAAFIRCEILKAHFVSKALGLTQESKKLLKAYNDYFAHLGYTGNCIDVIKRKFLGDECEQLFKPLQQYGILSFKKMLKHVETEELSNLDSRFDIHELANQNNPSIYTVSFLRSVLDITIGKKDFDKSTIGDCYISIGTIDTTPTYDGKPFYHLVTRHVDSTSEIAYKVYKKYR